MSAGIGMALINNSALLLSLSIIYEIMYIFRFQNKHLSKLLSGVLIGVIGIAVMSFPYELVPGVFYDARSTLLCVAALVFGFYPASVAACITIAYRLTMTATGLIPGIFIIVLSVVLGLLCRRFISMKPSRFRWLKLYIFGLIVHIAYLGGTFMLPLTTVLPVFKQIVIPVLGIDPIGVVLLSLLLFRQRERNEALFSAAEAESRYRSLFYNNHAVMLLIDPESGRIVDANPAALSFYGWPEAVIKSMNISQINTLSPEQLKTEMQNTIEKRRSYFVFRHNRASGSPADVEVYSGPIEFGGRKLLYSIVHDISERIATQKALQESEARFRQLVDNAPDAIFVMLDRKFAFANNAALRMLGAEHENELLGKPGQSIIHPDYFAEVQKYMDALRAGEISPVPAERSYIRLDGTIVYVDVIVVPIRYSDKDADLVLARDITERKRHQQKEQELEAQLRHQQKLEAIGTLAGGVAHEINNPLNGVMNYAQLILDASDKDSTTAEYSREIIHETERISGIVKNLLQFSRQEKQSHSYASIYDIVNQTVSLVKTIIKKDQIALDIRLDENLPDIKCRSQQIQQVIMNLLTNAKDAVNERFPGFDENKVIRLRCSLYWSDSRRWIRLTVQDYGAGIPPELGERIFEPFFSTKPKETGTGLGLSISYGIVAEHHGKLSFESEAGAGTTFILELPVDNGWSL